MNEPVGPEDLIRRIEACEAACVARDNEIWRLCGVIESHCRLLAGGQHSFALLEIRRELDR